MAPIGDSQRAQIVKLYQQKIELGEQLSEAKDQLNVDQGQYKVAAEAVSFGDKMKFWSDSPAEVARDQLERKVMQDENSVTTLRDSYGRTAKSLVEVTLAASGDPKILELKKTREAIKALMGPLNNVKEGIASNERATTATAANAQNLAISQVNRAQPKTDSMGNTIPADNSFNNLIGVMAATGAVAGTMSALDARSKALAAAAQFNTQATKIPEMNEAAFTNTADLGTVKGELAGLYEQVKGALDTATADLNGYVEQVATKATADVAQ